MQQYGVNVFKDEISISFFYECLLPNFTEETSMGRIMRLRQGENLTDEEKKIRNNYLLT